jgi:hypothetical protein
MVEKSTLSRKIDSRLRSLRTHLDALPWYAERYGSGPAAGAEPDATYDALHYEWRDTLDRFDGAHTWYLAGDMSDEQAERHRQNLALLATQLPLIRQLGLKMPGEALIVVPGVAGEKRAQARRA